MPPWGTPPPPLEGLIDCRVRCLLFAIFHRQWSARAPTRWVTGFAYPPPTGGVCFRVSDCRTGEPLPVHICVWGRQGKGGRLPTDRLVAILLHICGRPRCGCERIWLCAYRWSRSVRVSWRFVPAFHCESLVVDVHHSRTRHGLARHTSDKDG